MIILMGVSGTGKSTIGKLLSEELGLPFYDGDDFHPEQNLKKLASGIALSDADRQPWLEDLGSQIRRWQAAGGAILACSALKEKYRQTLRNASGQNLTFIHLHGDYELIAQRLRSRKNHFLDPAILGSQFEDLETPRDAVGVSIDQTPNQIIEEILLKMNKKASFGIIGLGVMGQNLAVNLANHKVSLSVFNRHVPGKEEDIAKDFVSTHDSLNIQGHDQLDQFVLSLEAPRNILLMVQAGAAVDSIIEELIPLLDANDLIIDGGNSNYQDTNRRDQHLAKHDINFIGTGISGGEEGARKGPSIMPGGSRIAYQRISSFLDLIAAKDSQGNPCCAYVGPEGSGHFVKMVHNGIEYAEMQLLAEVYELMRNGLAMSPEAIAQTFESWQTKGLDSYLLEITINILRKQDDQGLLLDKILDTASQKGTGGWSTEAAIKLGVPLNTISDAVMARNLSARKTLRTSANDLYGSMKEKIGEKTSELVEQVQNAYEAARIINHAVGFDMIQEASDQYNWSLDMSEIARIWTNGCIIRSELMNELIAIFGQTNHLLLHDKMVSRIKEIRSDLAHVLNIGLTHAYPLPVFSSAMNFFLGYVNGQSSANLLQAQRDYFGAHTYQRVDKPVTESYHTEWIAS